MLSQDEIDAAAGDGAHVIELEEFVLAGRDRPGRSTTGPTTSGPRQDGADAYRLLHDALAEDRPRRHRPLGVPQPRVPGRDPRARRGPRAAHDALRRRARRSERSSTCPAPSARPSGARSRWRGTLVESLHAAFDPDEFQRRLPRPRAPLLIEAKARCEEPELARAETRDSGTDLMGALEASLIKGQGADGPLAVDRLADASGWSTSRSRWSPRVRDLDLHFRQLHEKDGAPIEVQRWCFEGEVEVSTMMRSPTAYELDDGGQGDRL